MRKHDEIPEELRNLEFERSLVVYLLDSQNSLLDLANLMSDQFFYSEVYKKAFIFLKESFLKKEIISRAGLENFLKKKKLPSEWIFESSKIRDRNELKEVCVEIKGVFERRELYFSLQNSIKDVLVSEKEITKIKADLMGDLGKNTFAIGASEIPEIMVELKDEMKMIREGKRLKTGWDALDMITPQFIAGHLWIVGAHTGVGKTWFALQVTKNIIEQKGHVALFSTEMRKHENLGRILGNEAGGGFQSFWLQSGALESPTIEDYTGRVTPYLRIYDSLRTIKEIMAEARSLIFKGKLDVLVIDFIQNIDIGRRDVYEGFRAISHEVQAITKDLKITTILTSQLSNSYAKGGHLQNTIEYKNAGELAAAADVGILLFDDKDKYNEVMLRPEFKLPYGYKALLVDVRKSRHTGGGKVPMILEAPSGRILQAPGKWNWLDLDARDDWLKSQGQEDINYEENDNVID